MSVSYAGVPLEVATPEVAAWIEANISTRDVYQFSRHYFPETRVCRESMGGLVPENGQPDRPIKLGNLWWPRGASRWAVGHFLVTEDSLALIRPQVFAFTSQSLPSYQELPLVMSDEDVKGAGPQTVTTNLWMLPPRPLAQTNDPRFQNLYLMTLVDDRFWWWYAGGSVTVTENTTTWTQLFSSIATILGITITVDAIPAAYLNPSGNFQSYYELLPPLLDAVAYNVGMRIVRYLDGTVNALAADTSKANIGSNLVLVDFAGTRPTGTNGLKVQAGGRFALDPLITPNDLNAVMPKQVIVAFDVPGGAPYISTQTLASLNGPTGALADLANVQGNGNSKIYHDVALGDDSTTPSDKTQLDALAKQIAIDYYKAQYGATATAASTQASAASLLDLKLIGPVNWLMDGLHDSVEWVYHTEEQSTRIQRGEWNDLWLELMHASSLGSSMCGSGSTDSGHHFVKCLSVAPVSAGRYDARLQIEQADGTLADTGPSVWLRDCNNTPQLVLNEIYQVHLTGFTSARSVYTTGDFNLSVKDLFSGTQYDRVRRVLYDSTCQAYDSSKGNYVFTYNSTTRDLTVQLNGFTGTLHVLKPDCTTLTMVYCNGLLQVAT